MTRERANFSLGHHVMRQLLGVVGLSNALSHCHVFAAKLQGLVLVCVWVRKGFRRGRKSASSFVGHPT